MIRDPIAYLVTERLRKQHLIPEVVELTSGPRRPAESARSYLEALNEIDRERHHDEVEARIAKRRLTASSKEA